MNAETTVSAKGQIVIPKDVRDRLHWTSGHKLDVIVTGDMVLLRSVEADRPKIDYETFRRLVPKHNGPPVSIEDMNVAVDAMFAEKGRE
ncbi:MAG TPA: AbrB/MazE/SpoVT family DNA-binding domain-containing protein [Sphingomonas sp.]|jgi:AbrB family looped-hinge helix DNA binding protein|uniref:AbrB/MazE/SpoVT family DNA-binding domain-containing protein n=1 Tax=Sphingomonas sp. TaxID=28214 RepID=UPI002EDB7D0B